MTDRKERLERNRIIMAKLLRQKEQDVVVTLADNFVAGASKELVAKVNPGEKIELLDGNMVELGSLPATFTINAFKFKILHIIWLFQKHPKMLLAREKKTNNVYVCLRD